MPPGEDPGLGLGTRFWGGWWPAQGPGWGGGEQGHPLGPHWFHHLCSSPAAQFWLRSLQSPSSWDPRQGQALPQESAEKLLPLWISVMPHRPTFHIVSRGFPVPLEPCSADTPEKPGLSIENTCSRGESCHGDSLRACIPTVIAASSG